MTPSRVEALRRMAQADESPHERDVARAKLDAAGVGWRDPPRRPPAAPAPADFGGSWFTTTSTTVGPYVQVNIRFSRTVV